MNKKISFAQIIKKPVLFFAFGFGSGLSPIMPGTAGTLLGTCIYLGFAGLPFSLYVRLILVSIIFGVWICGRASKLLGVHDHPGIVWDEFVGIWITFIAVPDGVKWLVTGFVLFRVFDILKPWPIRVLDRRVSGGIGIMIDDILAGIFALVSLQFLVFISNHI